MKEYTDDYSSSPIVDISYFLCHKVCFLVFHQASHIPCLLEQLSTVDITGGLFFFYLIYSFACQQIVIWLYDITLGSHFKQKTLLKDHFRYWVSEF